MLPHEAFKKENSSMGTAIIDTEGAKLSPGASNVAPAA
jgi:hypothetical protein